MRANEYHKYEMLARDRYRMSAVRAGGHVSASYSARSACWRHEYCEYELSVCVGIIQREGCMRANEHGRCELVLASCSARAACSATRSDSTSCWHVSASYSTRAHERKRVPQVRAVGMCQHHTAQGLHAHRRVPQVRAGVMCQYHHQACMRAQVRAVVMCRHHTAPGMHARETSRKERAVVMCKHHTAAGLHEAQVRRQANALKTSFASTSC